MNEQNNLQPTEPIQDIKSTKTVWIVIISVIITALIVGGSIYLWQRSVLKSTKQSLQNQINSLQQQVKSLKNKQQLSDNSSDQVSKSTTQISDNKYEVVLKENTQDSNKTDVYLKNLGNDTETFFITITGDLYSQHYHNNEYHNGNLYIIKRTGFDNYSDKTWSDELWRYDSQKNGTKLYSDKGIDFRVNNNEDLIAIITNEAFTLLDNKGKTLKQFQSNEIVVDPEANPMFGFLAWGQNSIWLDNTLGPNLAGLVNVDTKTYAVTKYDLKHDLKDLPAEPEFAFNTQSEKLAFSNYPALFDVDGANDYKKSGEKVNLQIYDLNTKKQQLIDTSITKRFNPEWIDQNTLEYNDPNGKGRVQKVIE